MGTEQWEKEEEKERKDDETKNKRNVLKVSRFSGIFRGVGGVILLIFPQPSASLVHYACSPGGVEMEIVWHREHLCNDVFVGMSA